MERFAKVFESHDRQILVRKGEDSDGDAALCISTMFSGAEMSININFGDSDAALEKALENFGQEQADHFAKQFEGESSAFEAFQRLSSRASECDDE
ncbi:hypothetical protein [Pantoea sp.]|uniref:hypothetical protein n=1 Tax=Pantoea sp. TaxID=69393 RepID=UPI0028AAD1EE|nr:hypothetical protein [Pantoea sp.]